MSSMRHVPRVLLYSTSTLLNRIGEYLHNDQLSTTFAALADPTRRAILARLAQGEATVKELAEPFPISLQAVSKHLRVLERAGLIDRARTAQRRPSRLRAAPLKDAAEWLDAYRRFWSASFDRLDERLRADED
jgi:DNA-binding transcriptional ArsR family regulator